ncbi:glycoside hydrolase family 10 protein [Catellatospora methionotrophica]|uniref:glycoside hydrolase family 10 protein n=1 Tax=Catellatospora methionotrophica TaxID=121620 RepID=UPI0033EB0659
MRARRIMVMLLTTAVLTSAGCGQAAAPPDALTPAAAATAADGCPLGEAPKRALRGLWIASVVNINWPSATGLTPAQQQAELRSLFDRAAGLRFNAVFLQVRPTADAFWPSPFEPWSQYLTGAQGVSPGYDPLGFAVSEAHARNLELHAWFNPFRVSMQADVNQLVASHPGRRHPNWVETYDGRLYYNPGVPAARQHSADAIMDAVTRYDLDGVHFDDYFYPYPAAGQTFDDAAEFAAYGSGSTLGDWRRGNVDAFVQTLATRIKQAKPHVRFGISPFGIWRNQATDPLGSATNGLQSYDAIYADTRKWVKQEWIDYVAPQLYWTIGFPAAPYDALVPWWAQTVAGTRVQLYIGQAAYRIGGDTDPNWGDAAEMPDHLLLNRQHPEVAGDIYYSIEELLANPLGFADRLREDFHAHPALVPVSPMVPGTAPAAPGAVTASRVSGGVRLTWSAGGGAAPAYYAVYRADGAGCGVEAGRNLLATVRGGTTYTDPTPPPVGQVTYYVTALNRTHHESTPRGTTLQ